MKSNFTLLALLLIINLSMKAQTNLIHLVQFSTGYDSPLGIENCGDSRLFIVEQRGQISISDAAGNRRAKPFLNIGSRVNSTGNSQGLLGLAFDPHYLTNGYFYVDYINKSGFTQISRFKVSATDPNKADTASEKFILQVQQPFRYHNGGCIRFGPDGYLYIGTGDGDDEGGDPNNYSQNTQSLLGKMLRIEVPGKPYKIPSDNPFVDSANYRHEIWALGLRNPWRWSFDASTGNLIIADVGESTWEEINVQPAGSNGGENYGWRCYEGTKAFNTTGCKPKSNYTFPVVQYKHATTTGDCSITGGFVYRGSAYPSLAGKYFYADYCSGIIRMFRIADTLGKKIAYYGDVGAYTSFGEDYHHELYVTNFINGNIYRITDTTAEPRVNSVLQIPDMQVYPNPSSGNFVMTYNSATSQKANIRIQNIMGQQFYSGTKSVNAGTNTWKLNLPLPIGDYYISLIDASGNIISRQLRIQ
jgi:glucose/arabinose dehydrogenase